ncbi:MAG: UvrD-helicase domain-containing protein [Rickettsiales bacterium]
MNHNLNSLWISANAGSGKTTALTERVVTLMLMGAEPERICCITYTKAAASEMRARVLSFLRDKLMLASPESRRATLEKLTGVAATPALKTHAQGLFSRVLDSPSGGPQLTTIHGFCQSLLQRFPLESGISPHFTVLDDAQAASLQRRARNRLLMGFEGADTTLREALALIGNRMGEQRFSQWTQAITRDRAAWSVVWAHTTPQLLRKRLVELHDVTGLSREKLDAAFDAMINADDAAMLRAELPRFMELKPKEAVVLARWLETSAEARAPLRDDFCQLFLTKEGEPRSRLLPKDYTPDAPLRRWMERMVEECYRYRQQCAGIACAEETFAMAQLARVLLDLYAQAKAEAMALDYDDLIARATQLLANPGMLGWVMEKLDHRIDHLLIDEAQDTSAAQWSIARVLVEELIANAGGIGSGGLPRSLLVVGDEKQSIYSFQGAAPALFASQQSEFHAMLDGSEAPLAERTLAVSYRSASCVLTLVDAVAALPHVAPALSSVGEVAAHQLHRADATGQVVLHPPIAAPESEKLPPLTMPTHYPPRQSLAAAMADAMAVQVRALLDAGHPAGDVLILLHKRKPLMLPLLRALERRNVPVAGLDRLVLAEHLAVRDLLALMAWCGNTADDVALAQVLRSPLIGLSEEALLMLAHGRSGSLWSACDEPKLAHWLSLSALSPYAFLTQVLEVDGARRRFVTRFGQEVQEVLDELKMQAAMLPPNVLPTLAHFVDFVSTSRRTIKREAEAAGSHVRVMTVHGAKGLEAPIVLLADMASPPNTAKELVFFTDPTRGPQLPLLSLSDEAKAAPVLVAAKEAKKQALLAEYQRLLYVALTRARDQLYVFGVADKKGGFKPESWADSVAAGLQASCAKKQDEQWVLADGTGPETRMTEITAKETEPLPPWLSEAPAIPATRAVITAPSRLADAPHASDYVSGNADGRARGVRMHAVLQWLAASPEQADVARLMRHASPDWTEEALRVAVAEIEALRTAHPFLWQGTRLPEVTVAGSFMADDRSITARGQIDLLVDTPEGWVIVDYKTGPQVPGRAADVPLAYLLQLKTYRALVAELEPKRPVRVAILWTHTAQLMWLDTALDATPWHYQNVMGEAPVAA